MIDTSYIREKILDLAIRGKLVDQDPAEGDARELLAEIQAEKEELIKVKKIKKEKPLALITEEEIPFEIAESWVWVRLGDVANILMGQSPPGNSVFDGSDGIEFHQGKTFFGDKYLNPSKKYTTNPTRILDSNNIILSVRAPVGDVNINPKEICLGRGLCGINPYTRISTEFLYYLVTTLKQAFILKSTGTTFQAINKDTIVNQILALPPLAEQKRIVAKIEKAFSLLDEIEKAQNELIDLGDTLKAKVLDLAIRGEIVDQDPAEGTAKDLLAQIEANKEDLIKSKKIKKEKPLPAIKEEEIPFEIPDSWEWTRLFNVLDVRDGTHDTPKYVEHGVPLITSKNLIGNKLSFDNIKYISEYDAEIINERSKVDKFDILMAMIGSIGNATIVEDDYNIAIKNVALFKTWGMGLHQKYLYYYLISQERNMQETSSGGVQRFVSLKFLRNYTIPIPPLAEQKRIVAKIEEIFAAIDAISV